MAPAPGSFDPRRPTRRQLLKAGGLTLGALGLARSALAQTPRPGGVLVSAQTTEATGLDPQLVPAISRSRRSPLTYNQLVRFDPEMNPVPELAESWEIARDGVTWTFKLRQGVKFHDGSPFNATVARYSLERFVDPNTKNPEAAVLKPITAVKVVDEATLELTTDGPFAATLTALQNAFMMSPTAVQAAGDQVAKKPVGTGQYRFVEWVPGERLVMEANPDYWGTKAKIQRLTWKPVAEASTRIVALRTGLRWERLNQLSRAAELSVPVLIVHGDADETVPAVTSGAYAAARPDLVTYLAVPGAGHVEGWTSDRDGCGEALRTFVGRFAG